MWLQIGHSVPPVVIGLFAALFRQSLTAEAHFISIFYSFSSILFWIYTLRCQINGGVKIIGGGREFLKILINGRIKINGGRGIGENLEGQQSRHHTIQQNVRVMEYNFWREISRQKCTHTSVKCLLSIYCFCFGLWFIIGLEKLINGGGGPIKLCGVEKYRKINKLG